MSPTDVLLSAPQPPWVAFLRAQIVYRALELAWMILIRAALMVLIARGGVALFGTFDRVSGAGWALCALAGVTLTLLLASPVGDHPAARLAWWSAGVGAADAALSVPVAIGAFASGDLFSGLGKMHLRIPFLLLTLALPLGFDLLFWHVLTRIGNGIPSKNLSISYFAIRGLGTLLALPSLLAFETYRTLILESKWLGDTLMWTRFAIAIAHSVMVIVALSAVTKIACTESGFQGQTAQVAPAHASPQRDIMIGAAWLAGGSLFTVASYSTASGGGRYVVTTGAIVYGLVRLAKGLFRLGSTP